MKIHFIGIGGIGMSALADVVLSKGDTVTGSDLRPNNLTAMLEEKGALIHKGHSSGNIGQDVDLVVRSTCIKDGNPEVMRAKELGINMVLRGGLLKKIMSDFPKSIAVTGTHGKTTTSSIIAHTADFCSLEPTVLLGGEIERLGKNSKLGRGEMVIAEVDESDGTFREIPSTTALITNIEREHMEHYSSMEDLLSSYEKFISGIRPGGVLFYNGDDQRLNRMASASAVKSVSFGFGKNNDYTALVHEHKKNISFDVIFLGKTIGRVESPLIGKYNIMNLLGAIGVSLGEGMDFEKIKDAVKTFSGAKRRFQLIDEVADIKVIEDYAHHPTELKAVIEAARDYAEGRVISIFQPHRYSRTRDLMGDFSGCFNSSDIFILTDIYSADEDPKEKVEIKDLFDRIDKTVFEESYLEDKGKIPAIVSGIARRGDIVLVLGAGDIRDISGDLVNAIKNVKRDA